MFIISLGNFIKQEKDLSRSLNVSLECVCVWEGALMSFLLKKFKTKFPQLENNTIHNFADSFNNQENNTCDFNHQAGQGGQ